MKAIEIYYRHRKAAIYLNQKRY